MFGLVVKPAGSKLICENFDISDVSGTPACSARDIAIANASNTPERVEPSLDIFTNNSPGVPSSYVPTMAYPS